MNAMLCSAPAGKDRQLIVIYLKPKFANITIYCHHGKRSGAQINTKANLPNIGVSASNQSGSLIITLSVSLNTYTVTIGTGATENLTMGPNITEDRALFCWLCGRGF